jgi:TonB-dependent SusC/RagA subfamily outer membrane receptor
MRPLAPRPLRLVTATAAALLLVLAACLADQPLPVEPDTTPPASAAAEDIGGPDGIIELQRIEVEATRGRAPEARSVGETVRVQMRGPMAGLGASDAENSPLIVVNGEAWTLSGSEVELNPEDIASIEILKGAAAEARYGARGANGVILITLKEGV